MLTPDNQKIVAAPPLDPSDLSIGDLLHALADCRDKPLVFRYDAAGR
ncbi:hypothetical protein [Mesorhizobium sp. WSM3862]|nr:hypothetical protein [Mesorhizobium sp. WSM3862]